MTEPSPPQVREERARSSAVAELVGVSKHFATGTGMRRRRSYVHAVDGLDLAIPPGTTVGLVGETGSGKSTVARLLLRLLDPTSGKVLLDEDDVTATKGAALRDLRHKMQLVFQDPYSSFDPMTSVGASLGEALRAHSDLDRSGRRQRIAELLAQTGLPARMMHRRPKEMSGGQLQRAAVARALAVEPSLIALDEPVSSLDVSTQAQVINLLRELQERLGLAYLFISHDLSVVRHISHQIAVMYLGKLMEIGPAASVYHEPRHPYSKALLSAVPVPDPAHQRQRSRTILQGDIPSPLDPPSGCRFRTRCPSATDICAQQEPPPTTMADGTTVFCHLYTGPRSNGVQGAHPGTGGLGGERDAPTGKDT